MCERPIISTHIEKTGGTTISKCHIENCGPNHVLLYSPTTDTLFRAGTKEIIRTHPLIEFMRREVGRSRIYPLIHLFMAKSLEVTKNRHIQINELPTLNFKVVHGHFLSSKFDDVLPDALKTIVLRDPLDRMISHYHYWQNTKGNNTHRIRIPYKPNLGFENFSFLPALQNFQSQVIENSDLRRDFDLVGVTENLDAFSHTLRAKLLGIKKTKMCNSPHLKKNTSLHPEVLSVIGDTNFQKRFKSFHEADYENHETAKLLASKYSS